ncbi:hypothetical protein KUF57_25735 [Mycolicibacterium sp. PAM1]|uniref:hypothetical protein n=1 Tax=Mycolicibacterium sp. PAM1 TaxID=2853535 RepID=UPI001C3CE174|nr:hypothetical protein [Mycolicibacterium sp. PAM1]MBV5246933.1 hypothetical protein [Mycolicibacterium sp. PAM1]
MGSSHRHSRPAPSEALWAAAANAVQAGASNAKILTAMRLAEPEKTRARIQLDCLKRQLAPNPALSAQEALLQLTEVRREELERPIVDAVVANAEEIKRLFESSRALSDRRSVLVQELRDVNRMINEIDRVGLGTNRRAAIVVRHNQIVAGLLDLYESLSQILDEAEVVYVRNTALADRGLLLDGASVKETQSLGGVTRSDTRIYRSRQKLTDPPGCEHRFTPTLRELLPIFHAAEEAIAELRESMDADRRRLLNMPGQTDLPRA